MRSSRFLFLLLLSGYFLCSGLFGCGQIGYMSGGAKDTLAPVLESADPEYKSTNVNTRKFTFVFDEFVDLNNISSNLLVSPYQRLTPIVSFNRRTVTVRLKDSLLPNTTYNINFGQAIRDLNEGNILPGFTYVFSTGPVLDSLSVAGKVLMAESGKADSTLLVMLFLNAHDSAVKTRRPDYISRLNGNGNFRFDNLPGGFFKIYALKDGNGSKTYDSPREIFAFADSAVSSSAYPQTQILLAYAAEKENPSTAGTSKKEREFKFSFNLDRGKLDLLQPLEVSFSHAVVNADSVRFELADTLSDLGIVPAVWDSAQTKAKLLYSWKPGTEYRLIIPDSIIRDSLSQYIPGDTLSFNTFSNADYGRVMLRFTNIDLSRKPVLQFFKGAELSFSVPLSQEVWKDDMVRPGEYELRILYDDNGNGLWDPGDYDTRRQPEQVQTLMGTLSVRADWDNEREVIL